MSEREAMEFDVVVVGAGPAGLAAAIRLKQLAPEATVCVVEKGGEVGAHILSGAVIEPRALDELLPDWQERGAPLTTPATEDRFLFLTATGARKLPTPPQMHNHGNYIVSLGDVCRWLAAQAEALGVEIYPGFAAAELIEEDGRIVGVATGDMGITREGEHGPNYQPGMELRATYTLFAEGCRGSLTKQLMERFKLREGVRSADLRARHQGAVGDAEASNHRPGLIEHTIGWPLDRRHLWRLVALSFRREPGVLRVRRRAGLPQPVAVAVRGNAAAEDASRDAPAFRGRPADQLRRAGADRRRLPVDPEAHLPRRRADRRYRRVPQRAEDQGHACGDEVRHAGGRSGGRGAGRRTGRPSSPPSRTQFRASWLWRRARRRAQHPAGLRRWGLLGGLAYSALDTYLLRGRAPWTLHHKHADNDNPAGRRRAPPQIDYPKPDGKLTFDRLSSVFISNTNHEENQPVHLQLRDPARWLPVNWERYRAPESRYCPAGVYEAVGVEEGAPRLQINAQNCVHCKTCDIKDPTQNIDWVTPEGGGGPNYPGGM